MHTINFYEKDKPDGVAALQACASSPDKYYYAPDGDTLSVILSGIAEKVKTIRIQE